MCKKKDLDNKQIPSFCTHSGYRTYGRSTVSLRGLYNWQKSSASMCILHLFIQVHIYTHTCTHMYTHVHVHAHTQQKQQQQPQPSPSISLAQSWENTLGGALWQMFQEQGSTLLKPSLHALSSTPPQEWLGFCCVLSYASAHNPRDTIFKTDIYALRWSLLWPS